MPTTPDIQSDDYYKVLGCDRDAKENEIAKAYKKLALKHHPDKNPDDKESAEMRFKLITEAYEVLRDSEKRKFYDQHGKQGSCGGGGGSGGVSFQHADDLFRAFFGGNDPFSVFFDKDNSEDGGAFFNGGGMPGGARVQFAGMPGGFGGMPGGMFDMGGMGGKGGFPGMMGGMPGMMGKGGSKGGKRAAPAPAPPPHALPVGTRVTIRGLAKAQEHNGKVGRISGFDQGKGRYEVELQDDSSLSLKPANLTQQCTVRVRGIESQPTLNGQEGTILSYNADGGRYTVQLKQKMDNGRDVIALEVNKLLLEKGTRVTTQNLSNEQFNGLMAQITEIDTEALRYTVLTENGKAIKIKMDNVVC